jgi:hypothetical protein
VINVLLALSSVGVFAAESVTASNVDRVGEAEKFSFIMDEMLSAAIMVRALQMKIIAH